jgi:putative salt-induced outer membrane protein YdiY
MKTKFLIALALAAAQGAACADDNHDRTWSTAAELGAITTTGNTSGTSITGKIDARQELEDWSNQYMFSGFFKEDRTVDDRGEKHRTRSAERFATSAKAAYHLEDHNKKLFVLGSHVNDQFGAYTRYSSLSVGYSTRWFRSRDKTLDVELGPGYFIGKNATGETENGMTVRGAASYRWQVSPSALFTQTISMEKGTSNLHSQAESALSTKINGTMQMKAAFSARNDTNAPEDRKSTDTQTSLTLVYSF